MEKKVLLQIDGMTCVNCQDKIKNALEHTEGVISADVSYNHGHAEIVYDIEKTSVSDIISVIEKLDYNVRRNWKTQATVLMHTAGILAVIAVLYVALQSTGLLNLLAPGQLADTGMGYGMLFIIGLLTSVHCVAMCGGIHISQCIPQNSPADTTEDRGMGTFLPALLYNLGRVLSYTVIGFLLGLLGWLLGGDAEVGMGVFLQGILKMAAGIVMVIMGINMLGLFPALRRFTLRPPRVLTSRISVEKAKHSAPFYVGVLNGVMPCGPLQSMWMVAVAAGNPVAGALSMLLFSLGTVPLMLGLGSIFSVLGKKFAKQVMTVGAILVVVLGLAMLSQGGALSGWLSPDLLLILVIALSMAGVLLRLPVGKNAAKNRLKFAAVVLVAGSVVLWGYQGNLSSGAEAASNTSVTIENGVQVVHSTLEAGRYPDITVQAGVSVKWIIDAPQGSINGCNYKMLIREFDLEYAFQTGENVIEFTAEQNGIIRYSCWMGMIRGNIFVTDGTEAGAVAAGNVTEPTPSGYSIPVDEIAVASVITDAKGNPLQEVSIRLTEQGFVPAVVVVQKEINTIWSIDVAVEDADLGIDLLVSRYALLLTLKSGNNQLSLYPTEDFDIATGDYQAFAYLKVVDDLAEIDEAAIRAEVADYEPLIYPPDIYAGTGMSCCS